MEAEKLFWTSIFGVQKAVEGGAAIEFDQDVYVTVRLRLAARDRANTASGLTPILTKSG